MTRHKTGRVSTVVAVTSVAIMVVATLFLASCSSRSNSSPADISLKLERLVSEQAGNDKPGGNCVLAVARGDGSYSWAGGAGAAGQNDQARVTKDTPIYIASVTKMYTAAVVMKLYEQGLISLNDPMSKYLSPDLIKGIHVYKGNDYSNEITIEQLLSHTSGIADYYTEKGKDGKSLFDLFLENPGKSWTVDQVIARTRDELPPHFAPGTDAFYADTNFQLLGKIVENITGKRLQDLYADFIFRPCGCTHTWLVGLSQPQVAPSSAPADIFYNGKAITAMRSNGAYWADGGIISTAEDMIIFLKALNEGKIVSKDTLKLMRAWHKLEFPIQYGYGTMYFQLPQQMIKLSGLTPLIGHSGTTGSFLYYSEDLDLYMAGSLDSVGPNYKPFILMREVMQQFIPASGK
jgi:D-alanyl-D-alanine carboxypeptidase